MSNRGIPISPGVSWYESTIGERPSYSPLSGSTDADVVIVGGGFTGLSAAAHLAIQGADVVLLEADRIANGASGRNGGQLGTGQREWPEEQVEVFGFERAKALFELAHNAKQHLLAFVESTGLDIDFRSGQMSVVHKKSYLDDYKAHGDIMAERFGYPHIRFMDAAETAEKLGSERYHGGIYDSGTGHINPLKLALGTAAVANKNGAVIHEKTPVTKLYSNGGKVIAETATGMVTASQGLLAVNAYRAKLEPVTTAHVMPIGSFIGATVPLGDDSPVIPGGESVDDSRFVVRYFRKSVDGRLLFGGRETYSAKDPQGIREQIRRQITEIYPYLADIEITHAWGGYVGITLPRRPFVREVMPNIISAGGFSGHGIMLSNYTGRLYAEMIAGDREQLRLLEDLHIPGFPGGDRFRDPLLFLALNWYALRDRF